MTPARRLLLPLLLLLPLAASAAAPRKLLVYTRNYTPDGKGYVHDNIADSVVALRKIGAELHLAVDVSDDPAVFTDSNLRQYAALVFSNTNNEAFATQSQRDAFQHFIHAGGGFVGIHSASGSERDWPYFISVLGGRFAAHPHQQTFTVDVTDPSSPITRGLPAHLPWNDECYFLEHLEPDLHILLSTDRTRLSGLDALKINPADFPNPLPLAWTHHFDGGREFYLALGHNKQDYSNPMLYGLLERGILWAVTPTST